MFHATGSGKTLTAIAIAERFKHFKDVLIIAPKSLHDNFRKEVRRYAKKSTDRYKYVSSNASNMIDKLETEIDELTGLAIKSLHSLDHKFIIIDEAHNLLNGMVNGSQNATLLYDMIMKAKGCKILFLTASGIVNNFYEAIPCLNMCKGYIHNEDGDRLTLFPESNSDFVKYFVDETTLTLKNTDKLRNRMLGLVSYQGDLFEEKMDGFYDMLRRTISKEHYPDRLPIKIEMVRMSSIQYGEYSEAREKERSESRTGGFEKIPQKIGGELVRSNAFSRSTSYRIKSRQLSNIFVPEDPVIDIYAQMKTYSPKIYLIGSKIKQGRKAIVYSNFVKAGVEPMGQYLQTLGYNRYDPNNDTTPGEKGYFGVYSGDVLPEDRTSILNEFNSPDNELTVLLISSSGAEGLSTKGTRDVHIMEPYWNWERPLQVMARAIRYYSHEHLPKNQQNVKVYMYLSVYPEEIKLKEFPTDVYLFTEAVKKYEINIQMSKLLASTAVECDQFNKNVNFKCYHCDSSDGSPLYLPDLDQDMQYTSPCDQSTITAKEFKLNGSLYYIDPQSHIYTKSNNKYLEIVDPDVLSYIRGRIAAVKV